MTSRGPDIPHRGTSGWWFCSRLTAIHADTGDAWAASIRPGMGKFVASMRREMDVPEQVEAYLASQPEPKQADLRRLHAHILAEFPGCRLWFTDGTNADGKVVANPNIGYGAYTITYADGSSREFYRIGLSANTTGISVYVLGLDDTDLPGAHLWRLDRQGQCHGLLHQVQTPRSHKRRCPSGCHSIWDERPSGGLSRSRCASRTTCPPSAVSTGTVVRSSVR